MRRLDTKYMFSQHLLPELLRGLEDDYAVLEVGGSTQHGYLTLYFDTPGLTFFRDHHRGAGHRLKVRERQYQTTGQLFLEIKHRNNKGVTSKTRSEAPAWDPWLEPGAVPEELTEVTGLGKPLSGRLVPALWNAYDRVTLVGLGRLERVTLDTSLAFTGPDGASYSARGLAIAEVKQPRIDRSSPVMLRLRELGVRPAGLSKYCMGTSLLRPDMKNNRFRPKLRSLAAIVRGEALHA